MPIKQKKTIKVIKNPLDYQEALALMEEEKKLILSDLSEGKVFLLEQKPLYTAGSNSYQENFNLYGSTIDGIPLVPSDRGGKITYHGPGQRIIYFVLKLVEVVGSLDLRAFIEKLEKIVILTLKELRIKGQEDKNYPGIWVKQGDKLEKIAALGLRVSKGITSHGLAINVNNSLEPFKKITPCGIDSSDRGVTSISSLMGEVINLQELDKILIRQIKNILTFDN